MFGDARLGREVRLEVLVVVEVVLCDVRHDGDINLRAARAALIECVARQFHRGVSRAARDHRRQPVGKDL